MTELNNIPHGLRLVIWFHPRDRLGPRNYSTDLQFEGGYNWTRRRYDYQTTVHMTIPATKCKTKERQKENTMK